MFIIFDQFSFTTMRISRFFPLLIFKSLSAIVKSNPLEPAFYLAYFDRQDSISYN